MRKTLEKETRALKAKLDSRIVPEENMLTAFVNLAKESKVAKILLNTSKHAQV